MDDERARLEAQTARNLAGLEHELSGETEAAVALYEQNLDEGFAADWPYTRLESIYTKRGQPEEVIRVLERAIAVLSALPRRDPVRAPRLQSFRQRLKLARRTLQPPAPRRQRSAPSPPTPLPAGEGSKPLAATSLPAGEESTPERSAPLLPASDMKKGAQAPSPSRRGSG